MGIGEVRNTVAIVVLLMVRFTAAADAEPPEITAQGFNMAEAQQGEPGLFERLRVRFEVPGRIAELRIKERSYEVDLATTPEMDHLPLFGLERQVRQMNDVTLNFQPYVNRKLDNVGSYAFELTVVDRNGKRASALLRVELSSPEAEAQAEDSVALQTQRFRAIRVGIAPVTGAEELGLTWQTIERNRVVIRLATSAAEGYLFDVAASEYAAFTTRSQLRDAAQDSERQSMLELATAANRGTGRVFGVFSSETPRLVKVTRSDTSLSDMGTTVMLEGEFKF
jgi:hypothetical protein